MLWKYFINKDGSLLLLNLHQHSHRIFNLHQFRMILVVLLILSSTAFAYISVNNFEFPSQQYHSKTKFSRSQFVQNGRLHDYYEHRRNGLRIDYLKLNDRAKPKEVKVRSPFSLASHNIEEIEEDKRSNVVSALFSEFIHVYIISDI